MSKSKSSPKPYTETRRALLLRVYTIVVDGGDNALAEASEECRLRGIIPHMHTNMMLRWMDGRHRYEWAMGQLMALTSRQEIHGEAITPAEIQDWRLLASTQLAVKP